MILVFFIWVMILFVFSILGFAIVNLIKMINPIDQSSSALKIDEYFFFGFLTLSTVVGFLSIIIPIGNTILIIVCLLTLFLFLLNYKSLVAIVKDNLKIFSSLDNKEILILSFLVFFILTAVVQKITLGDTESYHAQSIQWIRKYAVIPGLGNIHGRLAFNSMFFEISGLFTFQIKDILIFPLNGICFIILLVKLFILYTKEFAAGETWRAVFYSLILLVSLLILLPNLNSPSPDIICCILIIYVILYIAEKFTAREKQMNMSQFILFSLAVFGSITFKLSSVFICLALFFYLDKEYLKRGLIAIIIAILVITPFILRNYYLSGYLIYPFPRIDLFNVDWKIPYEKVLDEKFWIESWAKIPSLPYSDVLKMKLSEWIIPWFNSHSFNDKLILSVCIFSIFTFITMIVRKEFLLAKIQFFIFVNLLFWFLSAPDPRFGYGFLFVTFSLTIAYLVRLIEYSYFSDIRRYIRIGLACFLILIVCKRMMFPVDSVRHPGYWFVSAPFSTVETNTYYSGFEYRVPVPEGGCYNIAIPCVPYPLSNIDLRGKGLQDGFRVVK